MAAVTSRRRTQKPDGETCPAFFVARPAGHINLASVEIGFIRGDKSPSGACNCGFQVQPGASNLPGRGMIHYLDTLGLELIQRLEAELQKPDHSTMC
jgi:hypothetical protein